MPLEEFEPAAVVGSSEGTTLRYVVTCGFLGIKWMVCDRMRGFTDIRLGLFFFPLLLLNAHTCLRRRSVGLSLRLGLEDAPEDKRRKEAAWEEPSLTRPS